MSLTSHLISVHQKGGRDMLNFLAFSWLAEPEKSGWLSERLDFIIIIIESYLPDSKNT